MQIIENLKYLCHLHFNVLCRNAWANFASISADTKNTNKHQCKQALFAILLHTPHSYLGNLATVTTFISGGRQ